MARAAAAGILVAILLLAAPAHASTPSPATLHAALAGEGALAIDGRILDRHSLNRYYEARGHAPAWLGGGAPLDRGQFVAALRDAPAHGLEPEHYHLASIDARRDGAGAAAIELELLLSDAFFRYATHMRMGRLDMADLEPDWQMPPTPFDAVQALGGIESPAAFAELLAALPPAHPDYRRLVQALAEYRGRLAGPPLPSVLPGPMIRLDAADERIPAVRRRLVSEGLLAADKTDSKVLDAELTAVLKTFQSGYGLNPDGLVGARTVLAMNISIATRVGQILANLERLRAMPRDRPATAIYVNVPAAQAVLIDDGEVAFAARVIVGTPANRTPVLAAQFRSLVWNPPWTVPLSIASREILPKLKRDPQHLAKQNMIVLNREYDPHGLDIDWSRYSRRYFPFTLRQLPGPRTALGHIKFEMSNRFDVYLHDTPDRRLFALGDRYFSHGCVRLENPRVLAAWLLRDNPDWTAEAIDAFIATGLTLRVALSRPIPIFLTYQTVYADLDGVLQFRHDIYGRDWRLNVALARLRDGSLPGRGIMVLAATEPGAPTTQSPRN